MAKKKKKVKFRFGCPTSQGHDISMPSFSHQVVVQGVCKKNDDDEHKRRVALYFYREAEKNEEIAIALRSSLIEEIDLEFDVPDSYPTLQELLSE